ncbi:hypothetical protein PVK06_035322 [Gossypium arboreum]|uniref:F-box domain-containing protein n=1 Tax=Gossypium arboreum TaxID=29729 RepID=A0ABR0NIN1_GOSAR|nr:hypothetical protein PVK06_035322 [Gossypium arboreum]
MSQSDYASSSLPKEIALEIASSLEVPTLSSSGCCSRDWQEICRSDCLWESLFKERWPLLYEADKDPNFKVVFLILKQHEEETRQAKSVINLVEQCSQFGSLEAVDYLHAINCLEMMQFGFRDVQMLLLKPKLNVLLNLIGLHYCLNNLQAFHITEALLSGKIADQQVFVKWVPPYNFRIRGGDQSRCVYLKDLVKEEDDGELLTELE